MLKKAGIVVAAATAGLLAVAPLAFAADRGDSDNGPRGSYSSTSEYDLDLESDYAGCDLGNYAEPTNTQEGEGYYFAILGAATGTLTQTFAPVNAPVQTLAPAASCNNLTFEDNTEDNDTTVGGSFNG